MRLSDTRATARMRAVLVLGKAARWLGYRVDFAPRRMRDGKRHRVAYLTRLAQRASMLDGDLVECGVGNGISFAALAGVAHARGRTLHGFDSFEGFPAPAAEDASPLRIRKGDWSHASLETVRTRVLGEVPESFLETGITITPGFFRDTVPGSDVGAICFLHIDADLHDSYMDVLRMLWSRIVPGGIVALDECLSGIEYAKYPGGFAAVDAFLGQGDEADLCRDRTTGKYYLVKR